MAACSSRRTDLLARSRAGILAAALAAATLVGITVAPPAGADQPKQTFVTGLTRAAGTIVDPAGRLWVADRIAGFCRVQEPTGTAPGRLDHPLTSTDSTAPTCLGGTLAQAGRGAKVPGSPAFFDPSPGQPGSGDELAFVPDQTPGGSQVIRAGWNPSSQKFEYRNTLQIFDGDLRPNAASLGADKNIYLSFERSRVIARLTYPEIQHPSLESIASATGPVTGIAAGNLSSGRNVVYVAEAAGITRFTAPPDETLANITPTTAFGVPKAGALFFDRDTNTLYAGTSTGTVSTDAGKDSVVKISLATGTVDSQWALGYSRVTGLGLLGGKVLAMDDAGLLTSGQPSGQGVMYRLSGAVVRITGGPTLASGQAAPDPGFTNDTTPTFTVASEPAGAMQCAITVGTATPAWADCTSGSFTPSAPLAAGAYTFRVTSTGGGASASRDFTVDTQAPAAPTITSPTASTPIGGSALFGATGETGATFVCSIDLTADADFSPCTPGTQLTFPTEGQHTLYVKAVDRATNRSAAASVVVQVDRTPPQVSITSPTEGSTLTVSQDVQMVFGSTSTDVDRFLCRLDAQAFTACTSPHTFTSVSAGQHRFEVQAVDRAGNTATAAVNATVVVSDTGAPTVTASPAAGTYGPSQSITLQSNEANTSIYYTTDGSTPTASSTRYTGPLPMASMTLKFFGIDSSQNASSVQTVAYVLDASAPTVSASPAPGTYAAGQQITLTSSEAGSIHYTTDGSTTKTTRTKYTGAITLSGPMTIRAIAVDTSGNTSSPASFAYQVTDTRAPVVSASPRAGQYASGTQISLSSDEANTSIYYTTDGSTPTTSSTKYASPLTLTSAMTLRFIGVDAAGNASAVGTESYTLAPTVVPWKDYTKDTRNDVIAIESSGAGWIYPGNGSGGWLARIGGGTWSGLTLVTATRDLDGDGVSDVVARDSSGVLWLYGGNGTGGWKARVQLATGLGTANLIVATGDWSGDGRSDLLIRDTSGALWLYPGTGTGAFGARTQVGWGWGTMNAVVSTGDFSGDGRSDVLARDSNGALWLYPGTGTGGFGTRSQIGSGWGVMNAILGIGDFNGDGRNDILAREAASGALWLYPGNGTGGWLARSQVGWGWNGFTLP